VRALLYVGGGVVALGLGYALYRASQSVSTTPGSMVRVPARAFLSGASSDAPLLSPADLQRAMALDPVATRAALPQGLDTIMDVEIVHSKTAPPGDMLVGVFMGPDKKPAPVLFHASAIVGASSAPQYFSTAIAQAGV